MESFGPGGGGYIHGHPPMLMNPPMDSRSLYYVNYPPARYPPYPSMPVGPVPHPMYCPPRLPPTGSPIPCVPSSVPRQSVKSDAMPVTPDNDASTYPYSYSQSMVGGRAILGTKKRVDVGSQITKGTRSPSPVQSQPHRISTPVQEADSGEKFRSIARGYGWVVEEDFQVRRQDEQHRSNVYSDQDPLQSGLNPATPEFKPTLSSTSPTKTRLNPDVEEYKPSLLRHSSESEGESVSSGSFTYRLPQRPAVLSGLSHTLKKRSDHVGTQTEIAGVNFDDGMCSECKKKLKVGSLGSLTAQPIFTKIKEISSEHKCKYVACQSSVLLRESPHILDKPEEFKTKVKKKLQAMCRQFGATIKDTTEWEDNVICEIAVNLLSDAPDMASAENSASFLRQLTEEVQSHLEIAQDLLNELEGNIQPFSKVEKPDKPHPSGGSQSDLSAQAVLQTDLQGGFSKAYSQGGMLQSTHGAPLPTSVSAAPLFSLPTSVTTSLLSQSASGIFGLGSSITTPGILTSSTSSMTSDFNAPIMNARLASSLNPAVGCQNLNLAGNTLGGSSSIGASGDNSALTSGLLELQKQQQAAEFLQMQQLYLQNLLSLTMANSLKNSNDNAFNKNATDTDRELPTSAVDTDIRTLLQSCKISDVPMHEQSSGQDSSGAVKLTTDNLKIHDALTSVKFSGDGKAHESDQGSSIDLVSAPSLPSEMLAPSGSVGLTSMKGISKPPSLKPGGMKTLKKLPPLDLRPSTLASKGLPPPLKLGKKTTSVKDFTGSTSRTNSAQEYPGVMPRFHDISDTTLVSQTVRSDAFGLTETSKMHNPVSKPSHFQSSFSATSNLNATTKSMVADDSGTSATGVRPRKFLTPLQRKRLKNAQTVTMPEEVSETHSIQPTCGRVMDEIDDGVVPKINSACLSSGVSSTSSVTAPTSEQVFKPVKDQSSHNILSSSIKHLTSWVQGIDQSFPSLQGSQYHGTELTESTYQPQGEVEISSPPKSHGTTQFSSHNVMYDRKQAPSVSCSSASLNSNDSGNMPIMSVQGNPTSSLKAEDLEAVGSQRVTSVHCKDSSLEYQQTEVDVVTEPPSKAEMLFKTGARKRSVLSVSSAESGEGSLSSETKVKVGGYGLDDISLLGSDVKAGKGEKTRQEAESESVACDDDHKDVRAKEPKNQRLEEEESQWRTVTKQKKNSKRQELQESKLEEFRTQEKYANLTKIIQEAHSFLSRLEAQAVLETVFTVTNGMTGMRQPQILEEARKAIEGLYPDMMSDENPKAQDDDDVSEHESVRTRTVESHVMYNIDEPDEVGNPTEEESVWNKVEAVGGCGVKSRDIGQPIDRDCKVQ